MKIAPKIAAAAVAALALGGAGAATAMAAGHGGSAGQSGRTAALVASAEPTSPDHDSVQQGDQTSPDVSPAAAGTSSPGPDASSPEGESTTENESAVSDGPGGHADPTGNVQHEFSGAE
jgi:nucleoside phosphorylase